MAIRFNFQKTITLSQKKARKEFLKEIFEREGKRLGELDYVFCDDPHILHINQLFLRHNYFTDIITFDMTEPGADMLNAEIYISVDTVASNALKFKTSFENELCRVMFHGALHLCGYKDKSEKERKLMRQKENFYLQQFMSQ